MNDLLNKYRPTKFEDVVGQSAVVKSLKAAIAKKAGKAFLFVGPSGCGKTTLAQNTATALGILPQDLQDIDAATYTGIDDMREIAESLRFKPLGAGTLKGVIIDECHALSKAAWQSLLKVLEKPPEYAFWFLCTTEAAKVPATVKTRCLSYTLKPVSDQDLSDLLEKVLKEEGLSLPDEVWYLVIEEAHGSPRQMLANLSVCLEAKTEKEAASLLESAIIESKAAIDLARALYKGADWFELQQIIAKMENENPESVRHVVRAYGTKIVLSAKSEKQAGLALEVLDKFSTPFYSGDGITPLLLACAKLTLQ